ncbi:MAG: Fic family protein [Bacteroidales bacterium]|nr:Fic family protein [Bacteroidales bacterium]
MNIELNNILTEIDRLKVELDNARPLPIEALKKIKAAFEMEYTFESNRMEGNTLTLQETALVVSEGVTISGKSMREHLEAINHAQAIELIKDIAKPDIEINERIIKEIHAIILHGIDKENAGKYRDVSVMIVGSTHTPPQPLLVPPLMEQFMEAYKKIKADLVHPVIISAFLHDELVKIHPFIDGNGRTSRLLMNLQLLAYGYPIANLKGDNQTKLFYYAALEQSHIENKPEAFYCLVAQEVKKSLEKYLSLIE